MIDVSVKELEEILEKQERVAVYWHTPLCGTCKAGARMLQVVEAMEPMLTIYAININLAPELGQTWRIESVPCLALLKKGALVTKSYRMDSVQSLHERLKSILPD